MQVYIIETCISLVRHSIYSWSLVHWKRIVVFFDCVMWHFLLGQITFLLLLPPTGSLNEKHCWSSSPGQLVEYCRIWGDVFLWNLLSFISKLVSYEQNWSWTLDFLFIDLLFQWIALLRLICDASSELFSIVFVVFSYMRWNMGWYFYALQNYLFHETAAGVVWLDINLGM